MAKIEKIDQKILNLVGIFDYEAEMDYGEYISLLKERMNADRMGQKVDSADASDIRDEWKRVKGKKGRFKVGIKKKAKKFVNGGEQKLLSGTQFTKPDKKKILPSGKVDNGGVKKVLNVKQQINPWESISKSINAIQNSINGIANILNKKNKIERAQQRVGFKISNAAKRDKKENELENKGIKAVKNIASKVMKPVKSFWDSIWNFFKWILLGSAVNKILEIIKDPEIILKPLRDFVNGIIDFLNGLMENIFNFFVAPFNLLIDGINNGVGFLYDRMNDIRSLVSNLPGVNLEPVEKPERINYVEKPDWLENMRIERWEKPDDKVQKLAGGGVTSNSGKKITGMGPDTQLIAAQPGEVVMSKNAVDHWGRDNLLSMNKEGGGTNISSFGSGPIQRMSGGGLVGGTSGSPKDSKNRKIFLHWNAGGYASNAGPYHQLFNSSGKPRSTGIDYSKDKGGHTGGHNTNSVGLGIAAMLESPGSGKLGYKDWPTKSQLNALVNESAGLANAWGWNESDVDKNVMTHGEWEREYVRSGAPGGVQRWDLDMLKDGQVTHPGGHFTTKQIKSKGGNTLRSRIKSAMRGGGGSGHIQTPELGRGPTPSIVPNTLNTASGISQVNGGGSGPRIVFVGGGDGGDQSNSSADKIKMFLPLFHQQILPILN